MSVSRPFFPTVGRRLEAIVLAYVNEPAPVLGQHGLRAQIRAVERRARRDGVEIGLLVIESGGRPMGTGRAMRLDDVLEAARCDPAERVLYVADPQRLAGDPAAVLRALHDVFAAGFEVRAPCGRISPTGRKVAAMQAAASPTRGARPSISALRQAKMRPSLNGGAGDATRTAGEAGS